MEKEEKVKKEEPKKYEIKSILDKKVTKPLQ